MAATLPTKILLKRVAGRISEAFHGPSRHRAGIRVLIYHNITEKPIPAEWDQMTTPKALFDSQMRFLKDGGYRAIGAGEVVSSLALGGEASARTVSVTFDDGYMDNYVNAFPVLQKYGMKATVFLTADFVGKDGYLGWDEIREMAKSGIFTFGCHSRSHKNLATLRGAELADEIEGARKMLEHGLGGCVDTYAYPFGWQGSFNKSVIEAVRRAGFSAAYTGIYGANTKDTDPFILRRIRVSWLEEPDEFEKILHGSYDWYSIYQGMVALWHRPQLNRT